MELQLRRYKRNNSTQALLFRDGEFWMHSLELPWLSNERAKSCIPAGKYKLEFRKADTPMTISYREKFGDDFTYHIEVQDVQNRDYIYIHWGNTVDDTDGCILLGRGAVTDSISNSRHAFKEFYRTVQPLLNAGESVTLEISNL